MGPALLALLLLLGCPAKPSVPASEDLPQEAGTEPSTVVPTRPLQPGEPVQQPVVSQASWGAAHPSEGFVAHRIERLSVHHTATPGGPPEQAARRMQSIQRFHQQDRGWPDIAYHFVVAASGQVFEGRPTDARGDTATSYDPSGHLLVTLEGNFEEQQPTEAQLEALARMLAWGAGHFEVDPATLSGHRDHAATACPGEHLYAALTDGSLLSRIRVLQEGGGVQLRYREPEPTADCRVAIDTGHSPAKPGATSARGVPEWQFNRTMALELTEALHRRGFEGAFLLDPEGVGLGLRERPEKAAEAEADLLLSIHHDSVQPHYLESWRVDGAERPCSDRFRGHSLFVSERNPRFARSRRFGELLGRALRTEGLEPTLHHAEPIEGENRPLLDSSLGLHRYDGLAVLAHAQSPALLLECGVLVHRDEEELLQSKKYRSRIVEAAVLAIGRFCAEGVSR